MRGAEPATTQTRELGVEEFQQMLDALARDIEHRADYLNVVESALMRDRVQATLLPTSQPVSVGYNASSFGWRFDPFNGRSTFHQGIDFAAPTGTPIAAAAGATAMIDISDGLVQDLGHIAAASAVSIGLDRSALVVPQVLVDVGAALGVDPYDWLLTGGDDHALAATFGAGVPDGWLVIGEVTAGAGVTVDGRPVAGGHDHFG